MKLDLMSDVHLEFGAYEPINTNQSDILVLAGDICVLSDIKYKSSEYNQRITDFFEFASKQYKRVLYVMGNHEHYHGNLMESADIIRNQFKYLSNVHLLDNSSIAIEDKTFVGGTLWTNCNHDPIAMNRIERLMNDYKCISYGNGILSIDNVLELHNETMEFFKKTVPYFHEVVVITHHSPSLRNLSIRFGDELSNPINLAYHSNLDSFILANPNIKLWLSGHTHDPFDNQIGTTRMVCNPRGYYGYEPTAFNYKPKTIEI